MKKCDFFLVEMKQMKIKYEYDSDAELFQNVLTKENCFEYQWLYLLLIHEYLLQQGGHDIIAATLHSSGKSGNIWLAGMLSLSYKNLFYALHLSSSDFLRLLYFSSLSPWISAFLIWCFLSPASWYPFCQKNIISQ